MSPEIAQVIGRYMDSVQKVWIYNTEGTAVTDTRVYTRMMLQAVASNGMENQMGAHSPGASMGFELFDERVDPEETGPHRPPIWRTPCCTLPPAPRAICLW